MYDQYLKNIKEKLKNNMDIIYRDILCHRGLVTLIFSNAITDKDFISHYIVSPIVEHDREIINVNVIKDKILFSSSVGEVPSFEDCIFRILSGDVILIFDFSQKVIFCEAKLLAERALERPLNDPVSKGSQEGFNETINNNISLLRKRIKSPLLKIENLQLGIESKTTVAIIYMDGKAPVDLIDLIRTKITNLRVDFIIDTNIIEEELKCKDTNFDTIGYTEKPDVVVSRLFEGRVAVMVDGCPTAITAPSFILGNFQSPEDYYLNKNTADIIRGIRLMSFAITMYLPGFYVALFTHHLSLIPQIYVFRSAESRSGVPLPIVIEVLVMLFFFELTRETGKRLPPSIGQPVSIIASLILGQAAIGAGLASDGTIIVMGVYAITSYINPKLSAATPTWTVLCIVMSALFGLHGFFIFNFVTIATISSLNSCGYPYLFPFGTAMKHTFKGGDYFSRGWLNQISSRLFQSGEKH